MYKKKNKGHFVLTVKDLTISTPWYKDVFGQLGFHVAYEDETNVYFLHDDLQFHVAIFQGHQEFQKDTFDRYRVGFHHFALTLASKEEVDQMYEFLQSKNIVCDEPPRHYPDYDNDLYYALFFHDPDGLRLEVFYEEDKLDT